MNWQDLRYHVRRLTEDRFGGEGGERRVKLVAVGAVLLVLSVWLAFNVAPMLTPRRRAQDPDSRGWRMVRELNESLVAKPAFADAAFDLESESPLKIRLVGAVRSQRDLASLREYLKELSAGAPPEQFEFAVEVHE